MKNRLITLLTIGALFIVQIINAQVTKNENSLICSTWECLEKNKNQEGIIQGVFRKYTPNEIGKGANVMYWEWELLLSDGYAVPVKSTDNIISYKDFEGKKVAIKGTVFYGTIIGRKNEDEQSAVGFRIDPIKIEEMKK